MKVALSKWTAENCRRVMCLDPNVREIFLEFIWRLAMSGIYVRIPDDGYIRTTEEQWKLYLKGRPWLVGGTYGRKVTWVTGKSSWHVNGLAIDLVPMKRIGPIWYEALWHREDIFREMARIAMDLGISWGYAQWGNDMPHFHFDEQGRMDIANVAKGWAWPRTPTFEITKKPQVLLRAIGRLMDDGIIPVT